jgi:hypothetical protein
MTYTAVIVEPRKHKALSFVLRNFLTNLSNEWNIILFHGLKNLEFVKDILKNDMTSEQVARISLENLNVDNLTRHTYSDLIKSIEFHNKIPTETFLIFQTDTMIFERNKHLINDFLEYDYVGSPWNKNIGWARSFDYVGNGGLSLRKKSKMVDIINNNPKGANNTSVLEDSFFSNTTNKLHKPDYEKAQTFAFETVFHENAFGCHAPWKYTKREIIYQYYPELKTLSDLQGTIL